MVRTSELVRRSPERDLPIYMYQVNKPRDCDSNGYLGCYHTTSNCRLSTRLEFASKQHLLDALIVGLWNPNTASLKDITHLWAHLLVRTFVAHYHLQSHFRIGLEIMLVSTLFVFFLSSHSAITAPTGSVN